jgi:hypothetical protein
MLSKGKEGEDVLTAKWCFQETLVLVFQYGRIQAELVGVNGIY